MQEELKKYEVDLQEQSKAQVVSLKLKLENLPLSEEERKRVEEEISGIEAGQKRLLTVKEAALASQLEKFAQEKKQEDAQNLQEYHKTLIQSATSQLDDLRRELEKNFKDEVLAEEAKMQAEAKAQQQRIGKLRDEKAEAAFKAQIQQEAERREKAVGKLRQQAEKLEQEILADLERLAKQVGQEKRVASLKVLKPGEKHQWSLWETDLTPDLLEILKREK